MAFSRNICFTGICLWHTYFWCLDITNEWANVWCLKRASCRPIWMLTIVMQSKYNYNSRAFLFERGFEWVINRHFFPGICFSGCVFMMKPFKNPLSHLKLRSSLMITRAKITRGIKIYCRKFLLTRNKWCALSAAAHSEWFTSSHKIRKLIAWKNRTKFHCK